MKYLKSFENTNSKPILGDWVYIEIDIDNFDWVKNSKKLIDFFSTNIGQVKKINPVNNRYLVEFFPKNDKEKKLLDVYSKENDYDEFVDPKYSYDFFSEEIEYFSSNKEDVERYIQAKKYNL